MAASNSPSGFTYRQRSSGDVVILHHGREATVLRGKRAAHFLTALENGDPQHVMARCTGNYRRGNERLGRDHPRNAQ